jgi:uncharacterized membrane protein
MLSRMNPAGRAFLLIAITAAIAVTPMLLFGNPRGHDFDVHFSTWLETEQQFHQGNLFPRWAAGANYGFGEPFFLFYPPLSRLIAGTIGLILPWRMVPGTYVWLVIVLAGLSMWKFASDWLAPSGAILASLIFAVNPYLIITAYRRCAYAELLAIALFPLVVWGGLRIGRDGSKTIMPLSLVFAAVWLADLPAGVIASYTLALLLVLSSIAHRSFRPIVYGALAILAAFGSIAFFLIPAAWERKWVTISAALRPEWAPDHNFLFIHNNTPHYLGFNRGLSFIALFLVIVVTIAAVLTHRLRRDIPDVWPSLTILGAISTFMMFRPSLIFYRILPEMSFVEFPWRWLTPLCVVMALLTSWAMARTRRKWISWVATAVLVGAVGAWIIHTVSWAPRHLNDLIEAAHSGAGYDDLARWSWPLGSDPAELSEAAPLVDSPDQDAQIHVERWSPERKVFSVESPRPLLLKIKLLSYPAWQGRLNGIVVPLETDKETGQMLLPVPAGVSRADIQFVRTWDRTAGMAVSLASILVFVLLMFFLRRRGTIN